MDPKNKQIIFYSRKNDKSSLLIVFLHFALVFIPFLFLINATQIYLKALGFIYVGVMLNGLLNLMHETSHYLVFIDKSRNSTLGKSILGPLFFSDFNSYRLRHWQHHLKLGIDGETKLTYLNQIKGKYFFLFLFKCIFLVELFTKLIGLKNVEANPNKKKSGLPKTQILRIISIQFLVFSLIFLTDLLLNHRTLLSTGFWSIVNYSIYLYCILSVTVFVSSLRAIAEHQIHQNQNVIVGFAALRNFECNWFSRIIFGSYGFGEHLTPHHNLAIPYYNLEKATDILVEENQEYHKGPGYFNTLFQQCGLKKIVKPKNSN